MIMRKQRDSGPLGEGFSLGSSVFGCVQKSFVYLFWLIHLFDICCLVSMCGHRSGVPHISVSLSVCPSYSRLLLWRKSLLCRVMPHVLLSLRTGQDWGSATAPRRAAELSREAS